jgi:hypothetical protein
MRTYMVSLVLVGLGLIVLDAGRCLADTSSRDARAARVGQHYLRAKKPGAGLEKVCPKIQVLGGNILYKYQASGHLANTERGSSCSFIYGPGNNSYPRQTNLPLYDSKGNQLGTFVAYQLGGCPYPARWYTRGPSCSQIANSAVAKTKSPAGYIGVGKGLCYKVNNLRGRQGSPNSAGNGSQCHH